MGLGDFLDGLGDAAQGVTKGVVGVGKGVWWASDPGHWDDIGRGAKAALEGASWLVEHPKYWDDAAKEIVRSQLTWENAGQTAAMMIATAGVGALAGAAGKGALTTAKVADTVSDTARAAKAVEDTAQVAQKAGRMARFAETYDTAMQAPTMAWRAGMKKLTGSELGPVAQGRLWAGTKVAGSEANLTTGKGVIGRMIKPGAEGRSWEAVKQGARATVGRNVQGSVTAPAEELGSFTKGAWRAQQAAKWKGRQETTEQIGKGYEEVYEIRGGPEAIADKALGEADKLASAATKPGGASKEPGTPEEGWYDPFAPVEEPEAAVLQSGVGMPNFGQIGQQAKYVAGRGWAPVRDRINQIDTKVGKFNQGRGGQALGYIGNKFTGPKGFWEGRTEWSGINSGYDWRDLGRPKIGRGQSRNAYKKAQAKDQAQQRGGAPGNMFVFSNSFNTNNSSTDNSRNHNEFNINMMGGGQNYPGMQMPTGGSPSPRGGGRRATPGFNGAQGGFGTDYEGGDEAVGAVGRGGDDNIIDVESWEPGAVGGPQRAIEAGHQFPAIEAGSRVTRSQNWNQTRQDLSDAAAMFPSMPSHFGD